MRTCVAHWLYTWLYCSLRNSGSNPGILPNIVHKVKTLGGKQTLLKHWEQRVLKN